MKDKVCKLCGDYTDSYFDDIICGHCSMQTLLLAECNIEPAYIYEFARLERIKPTRKRNG